MTSCNRPHALAPTSLRSFAAAGAGRSSASSFTVLGNKLFFSANDGTNGNELWVTDGTEAGTMLVADINSGSGSSSPTSFAPLGTELIFRVDDGTHGAELWVSDGTGPGTHLLKDINENWARCPAISRPI